MKQIIKNNSFLIFCLSVTLIYSLLILSVNYSHFPYKGFREFLSVVMHWFISSMGIYCILFAISINRYMFLVIFPIFVVITSITAFFTWQFDVSINPALIESLIMTNTREVSNYISFWLILVISLALILSVVIVAYRFQFKLSFKQLIWGTILFSVCFATFNYIDFKRNKSLLVRSPFSFYYATKKYIKEREELKKERNMIGNDAITTIDSITTIFIIGEALRADHLQMNGYHRITMPKVEQKGAVSLPNVFSPFTHTAQSIPYILTRANEKSQNPMSSESSFINTFNKAGFQTTWLGNQNPIESFRFFIGECDTFIINKPQLSDYSNSKRIDSELLPYFKDIIDLNKSKQLIIIHLLGNHWWYNNNMPDSFIVFKPVLESKIISQSNKERMINSYDNVTLFIDSIIEKIISKVENKTALLIFLSDHGQSFGEDGKWLHANDAPSEKNPACFVWFSAKYKTSFPDKINALEINRLKNINSSFLFHSIICGSGIQTTILENNNSVFNENFQQFQVNNDL